MVYQTQQTNRRPRSLKTETENTGKNKQKNMEEQIQSLRSATTKPLDGIRNPPPAMVFKERERRAVLLLSSFLAHQPNRQLFSGKDERIVWGQHDMSNNALVFGRLFSFIARIGDGIPVSSNTVALTQFSTSCVTFDSLADNEVYTIGLNAALVNKWSIRDEIYHFARGVEALLTGIVAVWDDLPLVRMAEAASFYVSDIGDASSLSDIESALFQDVSGKMQIDGIRITRSSSTDNMNKILSIYVGFHLHTLTWTRRAQQPPPKRARTELGSSSSSMLAADYEFGPLEAGDVKRTTDEVTENELFEQRSSARDTSSVFATNAPEEDVYASSALSKDDSTAYENERLLMAASVTPAAGTDVVSTFMSLLEQRGPVDQTKEQRAIMVATSGKAVHVVIDTRSPASVAADSADRTNLDHRLGEMDAPFADSNKVIYANGNQGVPSELWKHSQLLIDEAAIFSTAAKIDTRFDKALPPEQQIHKIGVESSRYSFWKRSISLRGIKPIAGGSHNIVYKWNESFNPGDTAFKNRVSSTRNYFETHVPPSSVQTKVIGKKGPSRRKNPAQPSQPSQPQSNVDMLIRIPKSVNDGSSFEEAIDTVHQYLVASKHNVGVKVAAVVIFDINRLYNERIWDDEKRKFLDVVPRDVVGVANSLTQQSLTQEQKDAIDRKKYGVIFVVEKLEIGPNDLNRMPVMQSMLNPRSFVDGKGTPTDNVNGIDEVHLAMFAVWKMLAAMSSIGLLYFDFHFGNVMFKKDFGGSGYTAKLIDIDPRWGRFLSYDELHGTNRTWKPLLVLNSLTFAFSLSNDLPRIGLLTKWMSADVDPGGLKLSGSAIDIGHWNKFQKICTEVSKSIDESEEEDLSVPEQLLSVVWNGGYRGTGVDAVRAAMTDEAVKGKLNEVQWAKIETLNAKMTGSYDFKTASTLSRMEAAMREPPYHRAFYEPQKRLLERWETRQTEVSKLINDITTTDKYLQFENVAALIAIEFKKTHTGALSSSDHYIRNVFDQANGPILRYTGNIPDQDVKMLDFLKGYVFKQRFRLNPAFVDENFYKNVLNPRHGDYKLNLKQRRADLLLFYDITEKSPTPTPTATGDAMADGV